MVADLFFFQLLNVFLVKCWLNLLLMSLPSTGKALLCRASQMAQMVKNLPAMWETWVRSLGQEDPLQKGMATHSCILAWRIPWTEETDGILSMGSQRVKHD